MFNLLHHFTCGLLLFSLNKKYTQASSFTAGPSGGSWHLTTVGETKTQLKSNLLLVSLRREVVLILALTSSPYQQILPFFPDMLAQELTGELMGGGWEERKNTARVGGGQPQGWREISYACALKRKVCGQLLKDFSGESRLSTESIEGVKEEKCCLLMPVQLNSAGVTQRHCQLCGCFFFFFSQVPILQIQPGRSVPKQWLAILT